MSNRKFGTIHTCRLMDVVRLTWRF